MTSDDLPTVDRDFAAALSRGDLAAAARLLEQGADVNRVIHTELWIERDCYQETTSYLTLAAGRGDVAAVRFLLQHGASVNAAGIFSGETPLLAAAKVGNADVIDPLVAYGADLAAVDTHDEQNAVDYAVRRVRPELLRRLLAAGARGTFFRLGVPVEGGAPAREVIRLLVKDGADINLIDDWGRTAFMWAAEYAELETVRLMIELGADVNRVSEPNSNGWQSYHTALGLARQAKRDDVVALLLAAGAKADPRGERGGGLTDGLVDRIRDALGLS